MLGCFHDGFAMIQVSELDLMWGGIRVRDQETSHAPADHVLVPCRCDSEFGGRLMFFLRQPPHAKRLDFAGGVLGRRGVPKLDGRLFGQRAILRNGGLLRVGGVRLYGGRFRHGCHDRQNWAHPSITLTGIARIVVRKCGDHTMRTI
ncbi:hypothetical protein RBSWK_02337 [Rhodopirellula baltica SWK14]|uniref:Uncharacterized protein n=1 Tax=Rhodopirellula baltica SWK14 TaxID=993516 RepID=L7CHH9_RHOBT|nr:hypothetical protein RBSWK_02337 [Rhodopirellula baltica SWK14]